MKQFTGLSYLLVVAFFGLVPLLVFPVPLHASANTRNSKEVVALLERARKASGGNAWSRVSALTFSGTENLSGMQGKFRGVDDVRAGRMRRETDFRVIKVAEVWDGQHHWRRDMSGGVHALDSEFALQAAVTDRWLARRAYLRPHAENASFGDVETRTDAGTRFAVVTATPLHGQGVELWFDLASALLARSVRVMPTTVETVSYTNYREVEGLQLPSRISTNNGTGDIDTLDISEYQVNTTIDNQIFQPPHTPNDTIVANGEATVPVEIGYFVTLEAQLNGQGPFAFLFDTGGHAILTPAAAAALGLHPAGAGSSGGAGEGRLSEQYVKIERMDIGGVTFRDQNFFVIPLQYDTVARGLRPPLAGILGLEILERLAVRLDYRHRTISFWPRESYRHEGQGIAVPITFSDDIPLVRARLESNPGDFALDTGNGGSLVVQHLWAEEYGLAEKMKRGVEMVSFGSGGESRNWASRVTDLELAGESFHNVVARYAEDKKGAFSSRTEAGNIGAQILANFTLDFDYAKGTIWFKFVPGFSSPPFPRSGMSVYQDDPQTVTVVNVLKDGPADKVGLRQGDVLVAINGKKAAELTSEQVRDIFTQAPGTPVPIRYRRQQQDAEAVLILKELLP